MKSLNKSQLKKVEGIAKTHLNCCHDVRVVERIYSTECHHLYIQVGDSHRNIVDSTALNNLLTALKKEGIVGSTTTAMWIGLIDETLSFWCVR